MAMVEGYGSALQDLGIFDAWEYSMGSVAHLDARDVASPYVVVVKTWCLQAVAPNCPVSPLVASGEDI